MTTAGWFVMSFAVLGMTGLLIWCMWKVLSTPGATEHLHSPSDIEPDDD
jgi:heme/copper-type cytochrome/quinol oxidase subunit 2